jgi:hypothetical protein
VDPFVTAGYSLFFERTASFLFATPVVEASLSLFNFGGGTNLWFSRHIGAKIEARDHVHSGSGSTVHYAEFMLGLAFH